MKKFNCQEMHERQKDLVHCLWCGKKIGLSYEEKQKEKVAAISLETKQELLDLLHEGKTIREARQIVNLELDVACGIINENIGEYKFLKTKAI